MNGDDAQWEDTDAWEDTEAPLPVQYHLELYEPNSALDVLLSVRTVTPLGPFTRGDLITLDSLSLGRSPGQILRVVSVEHILWIIDGSHVGEKVCVFTVAVADEAGQRRF